MESERAASIVKGGLWLYASRVVNMVSGFAFWLAVSAIAGPTPLGVASAVLGLSSMIGAVASLGMPRGLMRFLGMHAADRGEASKYFWSTVLAMTGLAALASTSLALAGALGLGIAGYTPQMLVAVAGLVVLTSVSGCVGSLLVSVIETKRLAAASAIGNAAKLALGPALVALGLGWRGVVAAYALPSIAVSLLGLSTVRKVAGLRPVLSRGRLINVVRAGMAVWVPSTILIVGQQLAIVLVFSSHGAVETGLLYVALTIAGFVTAVATSMTSLLLPVLSSMERGREELCSYVARLGLALVAPAAIALATYPSTVLALLGRSYLAASPMLRIVALASLATVVTASMSNYLYSGGEYRRVAVASTISSATRIVLYAALVPSYGALGAAIAYAAGSAVNMPYLAAVIRGRLRLAWGRIGIAIAVPSSVAAIAMVLGAPWYAGIAALTATYLVYTRIGVIERRDLSLLARALVGPGKAYAIYRRLRQVIDTVVPRSGEERR